jgi:hypothetical protein
MPVRRYPVPPGRMYVLAVTSLALFLAGLVLWPAPRPRYTAAVTVAQWPVGAIASKPAVAPRHFRLEPASRGGAAAEFTSEEALRYVWTQLNPRGSAASPASPAEFSALHRQIEVAASPGAAANQTLYTVRFTADSPERAVAAADLLARRFVAGRDGSRRSDATEQLERDERLEQAAEARQKLADAASAMDEFLARHFAELSEIEKINAAHRGTGGGRHAALANLTGPQLAPPQETHAGRRDDSTRDPVRELAELRHRRDQLLADLTPAHPEILRLDAAIRTLEREVDARSRPQGGAGEQPSDPAEPAFGDLFRDPPAPPDRSSPTEAAPAQGASPIGAKQLEKLQAAAREYAPLKAAYAEALRRYDEISQAGLAAGLPAASVQRAEIIEPVRLVGHTGGRPAPWRIFAVALGSLGIGGLFALAAGRKSSAPAFADPAEVETALDLPVVGTVSTSGRGAAALLGKQPAARRLATMATRIAECVLAVLLFGFLLAVALDSPLAARFLEDPFAAVSQASRRLLGG